MGSRYIGKRGPGLTELILLLLTFIRRFILIIWQYRFPAAFRGPRDSQHTHDALAEVNGGYLPRPNSVLRHLEQGLSRSRDGWAVVCLHQPPDHLSDVITSAKCQQCTWSRKEKEEENQTTGQSGCLAITYGQLDSTAQRLAAGLLSAHAQPGSTLLMLIPNGVEYALLIWACILLRITYVCVDPDIVGGSGYRVLKDIMRSVRPSVVVTAGSKQAIVVGIAIDDLQLAPPILVSLDHGSSQGWLSFKNLVSASPRMDMSHVLDQARNDNPNRINSVIFTSGTSGIPKGCPLRVASMCQILESQSWLVNQDNSARALQAAHNSRGIAAFQTLQTWKAGGAVVMIEKSCDITQMTEALRSHAPTFIAVSPSMASAIQEDIRKDPFTADSVQTVQVGGEAVTIGTLSECSALFPQAKVCVNHGMTEGGGSFYWPFFNKPLGQIPLFGELCPIGTVAAGSAVRVWDPSKRRPVRRTEVGELHIRGGCLLRQYMGGRSPESFHDDIQGHWLVTGDTAMIDQNGLVFILGRSRDIISTKAGTIVPVAIETAIHRYLGVQAAVVSVRHPTEGQMPVAIVKGYSRRTAREIVVHVTTILGKEYLLAGVLSLKQLELADFPRNGSGKIARVELEMAVKKALAPGDHSHP